MPLSRACAEQGRWLVLSRLKLYLRVQQGAVSRGDASQSEPAQLRDLLVAREAALATNQARISKLESLHKLAQDSAMKCEAELVACHEALSKTQMENQRLAAEAQQAR